MSKKAKLDAKVADGKLVVAIADGEQARVWRKDMAQLSSAALELKDVAGKTVLVIKMVDGTSEDIFIFSDRDSAVDGLHVVTHALFTQSPGAGNGAVLKPDNAKGGLFRRLLKGVMYLVIIVVAFVVLTVVVNALSSRGTPTSAVQGGAPMPADEMLK